MTGTGWASCSHAASILAGKQVTADALGPAIAARLVEVRQTSLRFRHQLSVSTAIYQAAGLAGRQAAHAALAQVLADQPDRQVWHKAAAALGPDEELAEARSTRPPPGPNGAVR